MKIIIFGLGSIGSRHAKILRQRKGLELFAYRTYKRGGSGAAIKEVTDWEAVDKIKPAVAFITNPTNLHIDTAIQCARRGMKLFIEKPLGSDIKNLDRLLTIVSQKKVVTYVAYVLRFHPVIQRLKKYFKKNQFLHLRAQATSYLPAWVPNKDHRKRYSAHSQLGGGVIYDLSHELDYTQYLLGPIKKVKGQFARRSDVTVDAEDYADILLETKLGPANIHINFMSHLPQRTVQIDFQGFSVEGDLIRNSVTEYLKNGRIRKYKLKDGLECAYADQAKYFFANLSNQKMMNNIFEAAELLKVMHQLKKAR